MDPTLDLVLINGVITPMVRRSGKTRSLVMAYNASEATVPLWVSVNKDSYGFVLPFLQSGRGALNSRYGLQALMDAVYDIRKELSMNPAATVEIFIDDIRSEFLARFLQKLYDNVPAADKIKINAVIVTDAKLSHVE